MAEPTSSTDPKQQAAHGVVAWLKNLGIQGLEDLTSPETVAKIDKALQSGFPVINTFIETFSGGGLLGAAEKVALPFVENEGVSLLNKALGNWHAHLASSTVAEVPALEAQALKAGTPGVQAVIVSGAEQAKFEALSPSEKAEYVHAHQQFVSGAVKS